MQLPILATLLLGAIAVGVHFADAADAPKHVEAPNVLGDWTGNWGAFDPTTMSKIAKETCKSLDCNVVQKDGVLQATFQGECGGPYKYTITMEGRPSGGAVLFRGTVDLGEKGGGIYDWVGRANDKEFIGFYTSSGHVGVFQLARKK